MKLIVELVRVNEEQIRNKREVKLIVAEWQLRQAAGHVARSLPRPIVVEKSAIRPVTKSAQGFGRPVEIPAISLEIADDLGHLVQIRLATPPDFLPGQIID